MWFSAAASPLCSWIRFNPRVEVSEVLAPSLRFPTLALEQAAVVVCERWGEMQMRAQMQENAHKSCSVANDRLPGCLATERHYLLLGSGPFL